ncbi:hypothetical protein C8R46DRAFT_396629 [Mycena filopes]|nr:hypothetical protein C8R46DRAFT_396629 [Mycena filopes]
MPNQHHDPLAQQLNDLAIANQDGLLNDDEYRLLRQNLFERYSGGVEIVSVTAGPASVLKAAPAAAPRRKHIELVEQPSPRTTPHITSPRSKISGVADFLRRATGRRPTSPPTPSPPPNIIKLSLIPRMFSKKSEDFSDTDSSGRTSSSPSEPAPKPRPRAPAPASPTRPTFQVAISPMRANFENPAAAVPIPTSPSRSAFAISPAPVAVAQLSKYDVVPGGSNDIFDDDNLQTSDAIRKVISAVEAEGRRLVAAFNDLETSAVIRYRQEHPQRQRSSPPVRRPGVSPVPSTSSRSRTNSHRQNLAPDAQSVRSNSSLRTTKSSGSLYHSSASASGSSPLPPPPPPSAGPSSGWAALSPKRLPSLRRKASTSSLTPSFLSVGRGASPNANANANAKPNLSRSSSMSRSTGHLPLPASSPPAGGGGSGSGSGSTMMELLASAGEGEGGAELAEVRRRRAEMVGRCEARLEYLRAKLKGAEIHEKLLKK